MLLAFLFVLSSSLTVSAAGQANGQDQLPFFLQFQEVNAPAPLGLYQPSILVEQSTTCENSDICCLQAHEDWELNVSSWWNERKRRKQRSAMAYRKMPAASSFSASLISNDTAQFSCFDGNHVPGQSWMFDQLHTRGYWLMNCPTGQKLQIIDTPRHLHSEILGLAPIYDESVVELKKYSQRAECYDPETGAVNYLEITIKGVQVACADVTAKKGAVIQMTGISGAFDFIVTSKDQVSMTSQVKMVAHRTSHLTFINLEKHALLRVCAFNAASKPQTVLITGASRYTRNEATSDTY